MLDARAGRLEAALARLAEAQAQTQAELRTLAERVEQLTDALRQLIVRVDRLDDRADRFVGRYLERHYREHTAASFQPILRRTQVIDPARLEQLADFSGSGGRIYVVSTRQVLLA